MNIPPPDAAVTAAHEAARHIPLGLIKPSPTNPRKRFDAAKLTELAESIKRLGGVFTPVLLRPNLDYAEGNGQPPYELVAGERRLRASQLAGMPTLLGLVRELTKVQTLEIQLLENIDREDLHPLEEAEGLHNLITSTATTPEAAAAKMGKSVRWVYLRLALLNLCPEAREALLDDRLSASVAGLIARMPDAGQQRDATARILTGFSGEPFSYRQASEYLKKEFMLDLGRATFDIHAAYNIAGPCTRCPKRNTARPDLFEDVKTGDLCQDSHCYRAKGEEAHERRIAACEALGHQVLRGDDAKRLMPSAATLQPTGYYFAHEPCTDINTSKLTLAEVAGDKQKGFVTVEHHANRALITLVPEALARKLLKAKGHLRPPAPAAAPTPAAAAPAPATTPAEPSPTAASQGEEARAQRQSREVPCSPAQMHQRIEARIGRVFSVSLFEALAASLASAEEPPLLVLRLVLTEYLMDTTAEGRELLELAHPALPGGRESDGYGARKAAVYRHLLQLTGRELANLLALTLVAEELSNEDDLDTLDAYSTSALPLAQYLQIDVEALQAQAADVAPGLVQDEEDARLGRTSAGDAFAAAHAD